MLWYGLGRPVITSEQVIGAFSYCRMAFRIRDNHEMGRAFSPFHPDAIATLGLIKEAASLLLLGYAKVSNTKDMLHRQICQGIFCVLDSSPNAHMLSG